MQFTFRSWLLLAVTAPLLGTMGLTMVGGWLAVGWLLFCCALLIADWRISPHQRDWQITRTCERRLSLAVENPIQINLMLRRGGRPLNVWLRDEPPPSFRCTPAVPVLEATVVPRQQSKLVYHVNPPRRGDYRFGNIHLRWTTMLGLWRRQATFVATDDTKVYPNLVDVRKYDLLLRKDRLWELGLRNTRLRGAGSEFERLRDYLPDDEYRRINWKATARRGKPISIEYETERSQHIVVLLDVGRMMRSPIGDVAKLDYAINAILLLAYVAAQKGDKIGLLAFADEVQCWVTPQGGKGQFHRLLEQLYAMESMPVEPDYHHAFRYFAAKLHRRSLVLVFTDLTGSIGGDALMAQMTRLRQGHLPLLVTMRDPTVQAMAHQAVADSATLYQRTVAETLLDERQLALQQLSHRGVLTLDVPADELSLAVINRYLELKAQSRI
ncbi:MAG: DUF58 domain-containing protein [Caldilineaceae bacterium]|nr:DUF58 domain-containing protein [Caldilineaceae bacterium]